MRPSLQIIEVLRENGGIILERTDSTASETEGALSMRPRYMRQNKNGTCKMLEECSELCDYQIKTAFIFTIDSCVLNCCYCGCAKQLWYVGSQGSRDGKKQHQMVELIRDRSPM